MPLGTLLLSTLNIRLRVRLHVTETKMVFTREISSPDETRPGMKSSLSMVKCLLLFTRFCRDELSSRDE